MKRMKKGFTLVEIMIVVAIIAILAAVAIPNFLRYRKSSQATACISNLKQIQTAKEQVLMAGGTPNEASIYGSDKLIKVKPHCPAENTADYTIGDATTDPTCGGSGANDTDYPHKLPSAATATTT